MTIARTRRIWQAFFLALFLFLALVTTEARLGGYPASILLELDPLTAIATAIATGSLYRGLWWAAVVMTATLLVGRAFCGWVCPFGTLHDLAAWLARPRPPARAIELNRYRRSQALKYYLLAGLGAAALGGLVQTGLLDPIALVSRSFTAAVWPAAARVGASPLRAPIIHFAWVLAGVFALLLALNAWQPRFFCRVLCPLGALLGLLSRFAWWRIDRDLARCNDCELCLKRCDAAADPHRTLRTAECHVCFDCLDDCPQDALAFRALPGIGPHTDAPDWTRRRAVVATLVGFVLAPVTRAGADPSDRPDPDVIRPPGALAERDFLARCIKCDQCIRVCPTSVLQPALLQSGLEGLWTPLLATRIGYCELNCVLCGHVCPTGAIERLTVERKLGVGRYQGHPVRVGTAFFDQGRCLPWAMDTPCVVCEEVCPTSPKAIFTREVEIVRRDGTPVRLRRPQVDAALCIGCGICERECPVRDRAGIRITAIGGTRAAASALLVGSV